MARVFRSVLAVAVEPGRGPACLDEMAEYLVDLDGIHDHSEDLHRAAALGTLKGINLVDLKAGLKTDSAYITAYMEIF